MDLNSAYGNAETLRRHGVTIAGQGNHALVFCHGYGCDQGVWSSLQPELCKLVPTVTFDMTGAGRSALKHFQPQGRHSTLDGYALDLIDVCDALAFKSLSFIGHSVGASVGLLAAKQRPSLFMELVLIAPSLSYINNGEYRGGFELEQINSLLDAMDDNFTDWAHMLAPVIVGAHEPSQAEGLAKSFCRWSEKAAKHFARLTFLSDCRDILPHIANSCLLLQCKNDAIAPAEVGRSMADALPQASLVELANVGHCPHLTAPQETLTAILDYLRYRGRF
jgi:sigma-B regulation protein RsbQ